mmetsp:Transcript_982/g.2531  ORF Transcript_982/g.2531 Transcript_982/m.2531 type:complete len:184 (+) Transcript_982:179-730(+)
MMHRSALLLTVGFLATAEAYQPSSRPPRAPQRVSVADESTPVFDLDADFDSPPDATTRRAALWRIPSAFTAIATAATATLAVSSKPAPSVALDFDAFVSRELGTNNNGRVEPAKMSDDEALCKFGAPSKATGNACLRAGLSTKRPTGVDAFGSVDRGDFVRCKPNYVDDPKRPGMLINVWDCQ